MAEKKPPKKLVHGTKRVFVTIGLFLLMQLVFFAVDGTFLAPKLNRMGNFAQEMVETTFFRNWFRFYENPIFNIITILAILHVLYISIMSVIVKNSVRDPNRT